jgi:hypothetical protein
LLFKELVGVKRLILPLLFELGRLAKHRLQHSSSCFSSGGRTSTTRDDASLASSTHVSKCELSAATESLVAWQIGHTKRAKFDVDVVDVAAACRCGHRGRRLERIEIVFIVVVDKCTIALNDEALVAVDLCALPDDVVLVVVLVAVAAALLRAAQPNGIVPVVMLPAAVVLENLGTLPNEFVFFAAADVLTTGALA